MAWSSLASGSRRLGHVLRIYSGRNTAIQLHPPTKRCISDGGNNIASLKNKFEGFEKGILKPLSSVMKPLGSAVNAVVKIDPDFKVIITVVPLVLASSFYFWTREYKGKIDVRDLSLQPTTALILPQPQSISQMRKVPVLNSNPNAESQVEHCTQTNLDTKTPPVEEVSDNMGNASPEKLPEPQLCMSPSGDNSEPMKLVPQVNSSEPQSALLESKSETETEAEESRQSRRRRRKLAREAAMKEQESGSNVE